MTLIGRKIRDNRDEMADDPGSVQLFRAVFQTMEFGVRRHYSDKPPRSDYLYPGPKIHYFRYDGRIGQRVNLTRKKR